MAWTSPISMPISSVLEQNVAVGRPEGTRSSVSSRSPFESEPWWTRDRSGRPRRRLATGEKARGLDLRLPVGEDQAVRP